MKKLIVTALVLGVFTISSCKKTDFSKIGFQSPVEKNSSGTCLMLAHADAGGIILEGKIRVDEGDILTELIQPDGKFVYSARHFAPAELTVDKFFNAQSGIWKLKYKSNDATGHINLHMSCN